MNVKQEKHQPWHRQHIKRRTLCLLVIGILSLNGCATQTELTAPCPNFGKHCSQIPINHWQYPPPD